MGLGGRHEEGEVWVFSVPSQRCSKVLWACAYPEREQVWHFEFCLFLTQESLSWHSAIHGYVCDCDR